MNLPRHPVAPPLTCDPMSSHFLKTALVLGLLSAIGPFAIDMYLPALPSIGKSLGTTVGAVQASLMAFFIALGLGQVLYGPVSDMVGRKAPLYFGLVLFALGSIGCALAPDIQTLVALRFVQGLGAWMARHGYASLADCRGLALEHGDSGARGFERAQYVRAIVDYQLRGRTIE